MTEQDIQQSTNEQPVSNDNKRVAVEEEKDSHASATERFGRRRKKQRLRVVPIWLRLLLAIVLIGGSLLLGLMVGYGVLGDGQPADALQTETWYHIFELMRGD